MPRKVPENSSGDLVGSLDPVGLIHVERGRSVRMTGSSGNGSTQGRQRQASELPRSGGDWPKGPCGRRALRDLIKARETPPGHRGREPLMTEPNEEYRVHPERKTLSPQWTTLPPMERELAGRAT